MGDIVLPGRRGFAMAAPAAVFEEDKEIAWVAAKERIVIRPDMGWIVANYVDLSTPETLRPNRNGHIFMLDDIAERFKLVIDTPYNWLHHERFIVGHYVDAEIMYHTGGDLPPGGHVETLSVFYRSIYEKHWQKVKDAHDAGMLYASMEGVPASVTCKLAGCCGETFPFAGVWSATYCDSMQKPGREFVCNQPLFIGGAVVVPPHQPGWRDASSIEVATWIETHLDEAEGLYNQLTANHPGVDDDQIEALIAGLVRAAGLEGDGNGGRSRQSLHVPSPEEIAASFAAMMQEELRPEPAADVVARRTETIEAQANHQGVIVAFVPPPEIVDQLAALGNEPPEAIHVTLAFLGDSAGDDSLDGVDGPITRDQVNAAVAVFAASERPVPARVSGLGRFSLAGESEATYASIDAPGLNELRARLVEYLRAVGVPPSTDHGFTPHATIQYHRPGEGPTDLPEDGLEWEIDSIEMWWGDDLHAPHGFGGVDTLETMAATFAIDALSSIDLDDGSVPSSQMMAALNTFTESARTGTLQAALDSGTLNEQVAGIVSDAITERVEG